MSEEQARALYTITGRRPRLARGVTARRSGRRRADELVDVVAPGTRLERRVEYWTYSDVCDTRDRPRLDALPYMHDLTFLTSRPLGWERAKTHGHVHTGPAGMVFAEAYEVLEGRGAVLIQDVRPGPTASFAVLVEAEAGECIVIPPFTHHATVNLGSDLLVISDLVSRSARDEYSQIRGSRGLAHYLGTDGRSRPNPTYQTVPSLTHVDASAWSDVSGSLYTMLLSDPASFDWLSDPKRFSSRFPTLWSRYCARKGRFP